MVELKTYTVDYLANIELEVIATSPQQAKRKAESMLGEHSTQLFPYIYISEIRFITDENGNEV